MWLFLQPSDVWLFRDGKPFDAGADHRARSLFPPNPTTIQGAIRAKILSLYGVDFDAYRQRSQDVNVEAVGEQIGYPADLSVDDPKPGTLGALEIKGPFLAKLDSEETITPYFPRPADLLWDEQHGKLVRVHPSNKQPFEANWPTGSELQPLIYDSLTSLERKEIWLSSQGLRAYLSGEIPSQEDYVESETLFTRENRFGVGLESGFKRPSEGLLYQVEYVRTRRQIGLLVRIEGVERQKWGERGVLRLGGEARAATYVVRDDIAGWPTNQMDEDHFKLYMATPTWFKNGWLPSDWSHFVGSADLDSAAVGRHRAIGGWDVAHNCQKPMRRFVPAGSVYFFTGTWNPDPPPKNICDESIEAQMGYGSYFIGR